MLPTIPAPTLLGPKVEEFLTYCRARNLSPHTIRAYSADLAEFVELLGGTETPISLINRKLLRRFLVRLSESGRAAASVRRKLAAVKSFCRWADGEGLLDAIALESIRGARPRQELPNVMNEAELKQLIDGEITTMCPERDRLILELLYGSGLRVSELVGINVDDFSDADTLLIRGKGRKERFVIVGECAREAIQTWLPLRSGLLAKFKLETPALLFSVGPHRSAERLDVRSVRRTIRDIAKIRGLDPEKWHPHMFRHAFATHLQDRGAPLQAVSSLLGHARLSTTQRYTRVSVGRMMRSYNAAHPHARG